MKTDMELKKLVDDELEGDLRVASEGIGVEVHQGIATLSGHIGTYSEKMAAERAAERVSGVEGAVVKLEVRPSVTQDDEAIVLAARNALQWYVHVPADDLQVEIEKGWITLRGTVRWGFQRHAAESAINHLRGVVGVLNLIRVEPKIVPEEIGGKIESAHYVTTLNGNPITSRSRQARAWSPWKAPWIPLLSAARLGARRGPHRAFPKSSTTFGSVKDWRNAIVPR